MKTATQIMYSIDDIVSAMPNKEVIEALARDDNTIRACLDVFRYSAGTATWEDALMLMVVNLQREKAAYFNQCLEMAKLSPPRPFTVRKEDWDNRLL